MMQNKLNKTIIPEAGPGVKTVGGKAVSYAEEVMTTLYIGHEDETDGDGNSVTRAFAFRVPNPVTRAKAINAAEMEAYGLRTAEEMASFNASLARKSRMNEDPDEIEEHDLFIDWVKVELTRIGITR